MKRLLIAPDDSIVRVSSSSFLMAGYVDEDHDPITERDSLTLRLLDGYAAQYAHSLKYKHEHPALDVFISAHC